MAKNAALPLVNDFSRQEFGQPRSACGCRECTINCEFIPGYLIPSDLERMAVLAAPLTLQQWATTHLLASPGAVVMQNGKRKRVPTIVPARQDNGWCKFLSESTPGVRSCTIHSVSPFGCAFFDSHKTAETASSLSRLGLTAIIEDMLNDGPYVRLWKALALMNLVAPSPEDCRFRMLNAYRKEMKLGEKEGG